MGAKLLKLSMAGYSYRTFACCSTQLFIQHIMSVLRYGSTNALTSPNTYREIFARTMPHHHTIYHSTNSTKERQHNCYSFESVQFIVEQRPSHLSLWIWLKLNIILNQRRISFHLYRISFDVCVLFEQHQAQLKAHNLN